MNSRSRSSLYLLPSNAHMSEETSDEAQPDFFTTSCPVGKSHNDSSSRTPFYVDSAAIDDDDKILESTANCSSTRFQGDEALRRLATNAMTKFRERVGSSPSTTGLVEQRTDGEFTITSTGVMPCTAHEITCVLSPDNMDRWNASMVEIFGNDYAYGVKVRTISDKNTSEHHGSYATLSVKMAHFAGSIPLLSTKCTTFFIDYTEFESEPSTKIWRMMQTIRRDLSGSLCPAGVLVGYYLQEHRDAHNSTIVYHASCSTAKVRDHTLRRLQKLSSIVTKAGDIALRLRLGRQEPVQHSRSSLERSSLIRSFISSSASASASATASPKTFFTDTATSIADQRTCSSCQRTLGKVLNAKRVCCVCGERVCSSCGAAHEVEYRIGVVNRVPVCTPCIGRLRSEAFGMNTGDGKADSVD